MAGFITVLILVNLPLLAGHVPESMIFSTGQILHGEWWRLVTHPFCHVTPYHLLLDGGAFLMLYETLAMKKIRHRLLAVFITGAGSLLGAVLFSDIIADYGLCGLSGIAHGLMAVVSLEWISDPGKRKQGLILLLIITGKTMLECITGDVLFASMHLGHCGMPVVSCHAGGVIAGILYGRFMNRRKE